MPVQIIRRSTADSGGGVVRTAITAGKADLGAGGSTPNGTAVVSSFGTANPGSLGTQVGGIIAAGRTQLPASGSGVAANPWVMPGLDFTNALVLRGLTDYLYLNMNGAALPSGAVFDIIIATQEDAS
jgi:hypothetical protein